MTCWLHIGVLVEQRYLVQAQPAGLRAALRARGHHVPMIDPQRISYEMGNDGWLDGLDLVIGRGRSWALLCLLAWAEAHGVMTINRRASIAGVHNKAEMAVALAVGNVPTPETHFGSVDRLAREVADTSFPLILKPIFGDNCQGLRVVSIREELAGSKWPEPVALAQSFLPGNGYDLKLYGIGEDIWAVRKPSPLLPNGTPSSDESNGRSSIAELLPTTPALQELGRRCGALFGLELFGVDCIQTPEGPVVIEVNEFPNYTGVPDAGEKLADYVIKRVQEGNGA